jgi:2-iminobutanoate/2-iminopropanoate deaminase
MSGERQAVRTPDAPQPIGKYSPAIKSGSFIFVSGQGPVDPATGAIVGVTIEEQTDQTMRNLESILIAAGSSLDAVVKVTAHLADLDDFPKYDQIYGVFFKEPYPARTTVGSALMGILVEIDAVAQFTLADGAH